MCSYCQDPRHKEYECRKQAKDLNMCLNCRQIGHRWKTGRGRSIVHPHTGEVKWLARPPFLEIREEIGDIEDSVSESEYQPAGAASAATR